MRHDQVKDQGRFLVWSVVSILESYYRVGGEGQGRRSDNQKYGSQKDGKGVWCR